MSTRSLFNIILKVIGIFFLKDILTSLPNLISVIFYLTDGEPANEALLTIIYSTITLSIYVIATYYLIFKSELIIDKLKLVKGFDQETIPLAIHRSTVLSISIIVIGGLILADEIPNLCHQLYAYLQEKQMTFGQTDPTFSYSILSAVKLVIGLLLIGNQRQIVNYIERKQRTQDLDNN